MARDGGRSGGGASYASRSRLAPDGAPALGRSVGGAGDGASFGTGGGDAKGRISAARYIAPARGSEHTVHRGRATSTASDDGRSVGGAGGGSSSRLAPDGARALERSVGGACDDASFRIAPDDAAALGAGQSHRHRFAGALERGSAPRAVAGATPAAQCRRRGGTGRDHGLGPERRGLGADGRRVAQAEVLQRPFDVGVAEDLAQPPGGRAAQRGQ